MTKWIGVGILALVLILGSPAAIHSAVAAQKQQTSAASDVDARRRVRHPVRYAYRPYVQPHYYDRPDYYRPYPYVLPVPFFLGFAFSPSW